MNGLLRMIDANANRAREALRVMEDVARFSLGNAALSERLKRVRHGLAAALNQIPGGALGLLAHRDTAGDVGTAISTPSEGQRAALRDVAVAACKRATEAVRVLEECAKVDSPEAGAGLERVRYALYDIERDLLLAMGTGRGVQWRLCVLLTESLCRLPWMEVAERAIAGGADCVQLREKDLPSAELLKRAAALVTLARHADHAVAVIVNDRADIALLSGADGVHVGQDDLAVRDVRRLAGDRLLVGVSTHDEVEARRAIEDGADYCGVGAMFTTSTKPRGVSGPEYLRRFIELTTTTRAMPHLAIGGIEPGNIGRLAAVGCRGVAVSACVCADADPAGQCRRLVEALR